MTATWRTLRPAYAVRSAAQQARRNTGSSGMTTVFRLAALAVALHFLISSNLLDNAGIPYDLPGGIPLVKFHPSTYLAALAGVLALKARANGRSSLAQAFRHSPATFGFIAAMLFCGVFALVSVGTKGAAVFVENYISAGMLAYALETCGEKARLTVGRMMLALTVFNVIVAVGETVLHAHVVPHFVGAEQYVDAEEDFRGTAGFEHPLTGAAVTMMSLLCLPALKLPPLVSVICFPVLCVGLLVFGGRTALGVGLIALIAVTLYLIGRGLAAQRLEPGLLAATVVAALLLPPAGYVMLKYTPVGERLVAHFYVDDSAEVRKVQWQVLDHLSTRDVLFGMPEEEIPFLILTVNLDQRLDMIENPWLLTFLKIGALGCTVFLAGLIPFVFRLWRNSALWGRTLVVCSLIVISASNSLGVKSNVLFLLTAFVVTSGGYRPRQVQAQIRSLAPSPRQIAANRPLFGLADNRRTLSRSVAP